MDHGFTLCLWALMKMTMRENEFVRRKAIFLREFQLYPLSMIALYYQTKAPISFFGISVD